MTVLARRRLGRTDLEVHPLCLGGNVFGWTADERASFEVLDRYVATGGNFIDTADAYSAWVPGHSGGESETVLGRWIERRGRSDDLVLATKVGALGGLGRENVLSCVEGSLKRLNVDHLDLLYAHFDDPEIPLQDALETFGELIKSGTVRHIGASNFSTARLREALAVAATMGLPGYTVTQSHYNLLERTQILDPQRPAEPFEPSLRKLCTDRGIAFIPYWVLAKGFLTGKYRQPTALRTESSRAEIHRPADYADSRATAALDALAAVADANEVPIAAVTLAWTAAQPGVVAPLASARTVTQLDQLLGFAALELSADELDFITAASA